MRLARIRTLAALCSGGTALIVSSCRGEAEREAVVDTTAVVSAAPRPTTAGECPLTGEWKLCSVRDRLENAGLAPQPRDSVRPPFVSVPGAVYGVGRGELQVFLYPDSATRARDFARFDPLSVQPPDTAVAWGATPTLIASNNMAAILLSDNAAQVERVRLALTAGLPEQ